MEKMGLLFFIIINVMLTVLCFATGKNQSIKGSPRACFQLSEYINACGQTLVMMYGNFCVAQGETWGKNTNKQTNKKHLCQLLAVAHKAY